MKSEFAANMALGRASITREQRLREKNDVYCDNARATLAELRERKAASNRWAVRLALLNAALIV